MGVHNFSIEQRVAWNARHCYCRARCGHHQGTAPTRPSGSAHSGSPLRSGRERAVSRSALRTRCAVPSTSGLLSAWRTASLSFGTLAADTRLDLVERRNALQRLDCDRRLRLGQIVEAPSAHGSNKKPALRKSRPIWTRRISCRPRSRRTAGCRGSRRAACWRGYAPGQARSCKPPPAVGCRPMADRHARWPRSSPASSARDLDRAPARRSRRRRSVSRRASSHAAAQPLGRPRPRRSPSRTTGWTDR